MTVIQGMEAAAKNTQSLWAKKHPFIPWLLQIGHCLGKDHPVVEILEDQRLNFATVVVGVTTCLQSAIIVAREAIML